MERQNLFCAGDNRVTPNEVARRLAAHGPPGRRTSLSTARGLVPGGMAPRGDHDLNPDFYDPKQVLVSAAVLVPIIERETGATLLFTRRTDHLDMHAGQISFPGGRVEAGESISEAALRETEEEVGLPRRHVTLVGQLDTYVTRTGIEVSPLVGVVRPPFPIVPDSFEVAEVFEVPLNFFLDTRNRAMHSRMYQGRERHFYAFPFGEYYIWGATAGMLVNLAEVLADGVAAES